MVERSRGKDANIRLAQKVCDIIIDGRDSRDVTHAADILACLAHVVAGTTLYVAQDPRLAASIIDDALIPEVHEQISGFASHLLKDRLP